MLALIQRVVLFGDAVGSIACPILAAIAYHNGLVDHAIFYGVFAIWFGRGAVARYMVRELTKAMQEDKQ